MRSLTWWWACVAALLSAACSDPGRLGTRDLEDALASERLGVRVELSAASQLTRVPDGFQPAPMASGYGRRLGAPRGEVVISSGTGVQAKLTPRSGPLDFAAWGPGVAAGEAVVYSSADGRAAQVLRPQPDGVKEDLVLTASLGDTVRFEWALEVAEGLVATLDDDGALRVRAKTGERQARFVIPAPVVRTRAGATTKQPVRFSLTGAGPWTLSLEANGLDALGYPLSIDPTIVVTSTAELLAGTLEDSTVVTAGAVVRSAPATIAANPVSQMAPTGLSSIDSHAAVAANGFVYVLGGTTGVLSNDVSYATLAPGAVGTFTSTTPFTTPRVGLGAAATNGFLYLMGGSDGGTGQLGDVQWAPINANGTLGSFSAVTLPAAQRRSEHCVVASNGYLYLAGGTSPSVGVPLSDVQVARLNADGSPGSFSATSALPGPRSGLACVITGGRFYVLGGATSPSTVINTVHFAAILPDGTLGPFVQTTSFPNARFRHVVAAVDGLMLVSGGRAGVAIFSDLLFARINADGTLSEFRSAGLGFQQRFAHAAVSTGGVLTLLGGRDSSTRVNDVAHVVTSSLPTILPPSPSSVGLSSDRADAVVVPHRGRLYLIGGTPAADLEVAPLLTDGGFGTFVSVATSPNGVYGHAAFIRDEWLYSLGGVRGANPQSLVERVELYPDGGAGVFADEPTFLPQPLREHTVSVAGSTMYVVGGLTGVGITTGETPRATVWRAPLDGGAFIDAGTLPGTRWGHASVVHNGKLYVIGGSAGDAGTPGAVADVFVATINADGSLSSFAPTTSLPDARRNHVAVAASGTLVVYGGETNAGGASNVAWVSRFLADGGLDSFASQGGVIGFAARASQAGAFADGNLIVLGGTGSLSSTREGRVMPIGGTRGMLAPFTAQGAIFDPRAHHATVAANGWLYVLGGSRGSVPLTDVQYAPIAADGLVGAASPDTLPAALAREGLGAVAVQGRVYLVGGRNSTAAYNDVQYASILSDGSLGPYSAGASFSIGRDRHAVVSYRGWLYVIGGRDQALAPLSDVQRAAINTNGSVGTFTPTTPLTSPRHSLTAVAHDGWLYVIGGASNGNRLAIVEAAPINADGSLGSFSARTALPGARSEHASFAAGGFLYVLGGTVGFAVDDVLYAPISAGGLLGPFQVTKSFQSARRGLAVATLAGRVYVTGGLDDNSAELLDVQVASLSTSPAVGTYSKLFDTNGRSTLVSLTVGGTSAARGAVSLRTAAAPLSGLFGATAGPSAVTLGTPVPLGQTNQRWLWAQVTLDDSDAVVVNPDAPRRDVTDLSLLYNPNPQLTPPTATCPPRGLVSFTCSGGSDAGFTFAVTTNASMGASVNASGQYQAGATGNVTDVVQCIDSAGVSETAQVLVGPGVSISPGGPNVAPRGSLAFVADGGSRTGFNWSLPSNASSGAIVAATGAYTAGATGNVTDVVAVVDSLGNTAQVSVAVGPQVSITPATVAVPPGGSQVFGADGGSRAFTFSLLFNNSDGGLTGSAYTAGSVGNTTDAVRVTDTLGNTATATITVGPGVSVAPASVMLPPRGRQQFTASGGTDAGFAWSLSPSGSSGTVSATGSYQAGAVGNSTDVVVARDNLGNVGAATVSVGPGISVSPSSPTTAPRATITFTAMGGSNLGFMYGLVSTQSDASITDAGVYTAGPGRLQGDGGIFDIDTVRVVDSLGNTLDFTVEVTNGLGITPRAVSVPPRSLVSLSVTGGSAPYGWSVPTNRSGGSLDAGAASAEYQVGPVGSVVDEVRVTDALGEFRTSTITVTAGVSVMPATASSPPRGSVSFTANGGAGAPFAWSLATNASGGSITPSGVYTAGSTGAVSDVVQATDPLGNVASATVMVGPVISIVPPSSSVPPRGQQAFSASGGAGSYSWTVVSPSGGLINGVTGEYTAGSLGGVTDIVQVRDPLGNTASANVSVTGSLSLMPTAPSVAPNGPLTFTAQGGTPPLRWELMPNRSGGTLDMLGAYRAGATPSVTDTVRVTDSLGNSVSTDVAVGVGVSISPANPTIGAGGAVVFTASGGSGEGYQWAITSNVSGGSILADGTFTAGPTVGLDTVQVTDSLGNTASTSVSVISGGVVNQVPFSQRPPVSGWSCGCSTGGDALGVVALALLLARARRRRGAGLLAVVLVASLPALAAPAGTKKKKEKPAVTKPAVTPQPTPPVTPPAPEPPPAPVVTTPPPAPMPKDGKLSVAVLDIDVTVPNEKLDGAAFSEMLVNSIDGTGMFRVISSKEIVTLIGLERQRQLLGCSEDSSCMAEIANALGSELVAQGSVGKVGATYLVSVRLIDGRTSRTAARANAEVTDPNALLRAVWTSSQEMLDKYGASLPPEQAAKWAARPKQQAPAQVAVDTTPNFFGVQAGAVAGYQVLSEAGKRGSIGAQVDVTFQRGRLDLAAGLIIGPNLGVRLTATWALIASRFRLGVGLRGAGYPGIGLYGGGLVTTAEFTIVSVWSVFAAGGAEVSPGGSAPVLVLLGTAGTGVRF
ncbi:MAG: hypothetical protein JNJ54_06355 [Myxococcaceae bacterium]|nr:hypothetical protein [Myxococcaceae bacterium]